MERSFANRRRHTARADHLATAEKLQETVPKLGRHQVVEDGVDCRVHVQHDSTKVQDNVESLEPNGHDVLARDDDYPQGQSTEWEQTEEEADNYCTQHKHNLLSVLEHVAPVSAGVGHDDARVVHQVFCYYRVQHHQDEQRENKENHDATNKKGRMPEVFHWGQAGGNHVSVYVLHVFVC